MLTTKNEANKEQPIYYISRTLVEYKGKYIYIEKTYLAVVFTTKKIHHYMLNNTTHVIAKVNPLWYMMSKPYHNSWTIKWIMTLIKLDLEFISQKSIKEQVIADQLVEAPLHDDKPLIFSLLIILVITS